MSHPENPSGTHGRYLGLGVSYTFGDGELLKEGQLVKRMGIQASAIFEMLLLRAGTPVTLYDLAQAGGDMLLEPSYPYPILWYDDVARVRSSVQRIRNDLELAAHGLSKNLETVHARGYRWVDRD